MIAPPVPLPPRPRAAAASPSARRRGLSIMEMLVALAISALLLTAVTVALNASFYAYANAAESASTHSSVRLVMQRTMRMIRNSALHDAYDPSGSITLQAPGLGPLHTVGLQMLNEEGDVLKLWWAPNANYGDPLVGDLWYSEGFQVQVLLEQVTAQVDAAGKPYVFSLVSRHSPEGLLLSRATLDISVKPGADATLSVESARGRSQPVRLLASTMPRRNLE